MATQKRLWSHARAFEAVWIERWGCCHFNFLRKSAAPAREIAVSLVLKHLTERSPVESDALGQ